MVSDRAFINSLSAVDDRMAEGGESVAPAASAAEVARRRRFGFAVETELRPHGQMPLPPLARRLVGLGDTVLLVSTGHQFQIWDLEFVLSRGAPDLVTLANLHSTVPDPIGGRHESRLQTLRAPCRLAFSGQSGLSLQPVLPVPHRSDALGAPGLQ